MSGLNNITNTSCDSSSAINSRNAALSSKQDDPDLTPTVERNNFFGANTTGHPQDSLQAGNSRLHQHTNTNAMAPTQSPIAYMRTNSPPSSALPLPSSSAGRGAASPTRQMRSVSPSHSMDSSSIFERDVQESIVPSEMSTAIPSHIQTEDHIPPVLEASSLAITDSHLNPDQVEIVTHSAHHTAAESVLHPETAHDPQHDSMSASHLSETDDTASNYGQLDPTDVRRLSFISFADVVQAEHADSGPNSSLHHVPSSGIAQQSHNQSPPVDRSPSPARSPYSQHITTPPLSGNQGSTRGSELSPSRGSIGGAQQHGELTIETMRQALRKTGSGDLKAAARKGSIPQSPAS